MWRAGPKSKGYLRRYAKTSQIKGLLHTKSAFYTLECIALLKYLSEQQHLRSLFQTGVIYTAPSKTKAAFHVP